MGLRVSPKHVFLDIRVLGLGFTERVSGLRFCVIGVIYGYVWMYGLKKGHVRIYRDGSGSNSEA